MLVTGKNARPEKASDRGVERGDGGKGGGGVLWLPKSVLYSSSLGKIGRCPHEIVSN